MKKLIFIIVLFFSFNVMATNFVCNTDKKFYTITNEKDSKIISQFGIVSDAQLIVMDESKTDTFEAIIVGKKWSDDEILLKGHTYGKNFDEYGSRVFFFQIQKTLLSNKIVFRVWYGDDEINKGTYTMSRQ